MVRTHSRYAKEKLRQDQHVCGPIPPQSVCHA